MNRIPIRIFIGLLMLSFSLILASEAVTESNGKSETAAIRLTATLPPQLNLSLGEVALNIPVSNPSQSSQVVTVSLTSSWALDSSTTSVELVGYFDLPASALMDRAGHSIPADHVLSGLVGDTMLPFVETSRLGTANASRTFFHQQITRLNVTGTRADKLQIQLSRIDDLGMPSAEYRGVLNLRLVSY